MFSQVKTASLVMLMAMHALQASVPEIPQVGVTYGPTEQQVTAMQKIDDLGRIKVVTATIMAEYECRLKKVRACVEKNDPACPARETLRAYLDLLAWCAHKDFKKTPQLCREYDSNITIRTVRMSNTEKTAQDSERAAEEAYVKAEELRLFKLVHALRAALE